MCDSYVIYKMTLPDNSILEGVTHVVPLPASYLTSQMLPNGFPTKAVYLCKDGGLWSRGC